MQSRRPLLAVVGSDAADPAGAALLRLAHRDHTALADVYDLTIEPVHRLAMLLTAGDLPAAEHVVARTYQAVARQAGAFPESAMSGVAWVVTHTHRLAREAGDLR